MIDLKTKDYIFICQTAKEVLKSQPVLIEMKGPVNICGKNFKLLKKV